MKRFIILVFAAILVFMGCTVEDCDDRERIIYVEEDYVPAVPRGLYSVTHDGYVELGWYPNREDDLAGYNVYWNDEASGEYELMAFTEDSVYFDYDVENGNTYFYAISAVDQNGNESELSPELVHDTPRPEGTNAKVYNYNVSPTASGFDFSMGMVSDGDAILSDIVFSVDREVGYYFIQTTNDNIDIQDFGYTDYLDQVDYAPEQGWSGLGEVEAILGHAYIVWTDDNHFAKFRITGLTSDYLVMDWAYQVDEGNREVRKKSKKKEGKK